MWKVGCEPQSLTPDPADPLDSRDLGMCAKVVFRPREASTFLKCSSFPVAFGCFA